jgi:hypothetical protein
MIFLRFQYGLTFLHWLVGLLSHNMYDFCLGVWPRITQHFLLKSQ